MYWLQTVKIRGAFVIATIRTAAKLAFQDLFLRYYLISLTLSIGASWGRYCCCHAAVFETNVHVLLLASTGEQIVQFLILDTAQVGVVVIDALLASLMTVLMVVC